MERLIIVSETIYLGSTLEVDEREWSKVKNENHYYTCKVSSQKKAYILLNDIYTEVSSKINEIAPKDNIKELIIAGHKDCIDWERTNVRDEKKDEFEHSPTDDTFNAIRELIEDPSISNFKNVVETVTTEEDDVEKKGEPKKRDKMTAVKLGDIRHKITTQFISIQFDMQAILNQSSSESRIKCAKSIKNDYLKNNTFPCSKNLARALYFITGYKYSVNGYMMESNSDDRLLDITLRDFVKIGKISTEKYNSILKKCPVERHNGRSVELKYDACVVKFLDGIDKAVDEKSPSDLAKVAVNGIDRCFKASVNSSIQSNHLAEQQSLSNGDYIEEYNAENFCDWFDALSRDVSDLTIT
jgi:hypothetical protein